METEITVRGEAVHVRQRGGGPPVLLIHGFPSNSLAWKLVMDRLDDRYRLIAPDMVGFGRSTRKPARPLDGDTYADRLVDLLDRLELEAVHLAGMSWGGSVAQRVALRHPARVRRLVLLASTSAATPLRFGDGDLMGLALGSLVPPLARFAVRRYVGGATRGTASEADVEEITRGYVDPLATPGSLAFLRRFVRATRATPNAELARISVPTLVITPAEDRIVSPSVGANLQAAIPGAHREVIHGAGHAIGFQEPRAVAELMDRFFSADACHGLPT
ncbi:MAG TPA: alpha/beta hydrolase [Candidatus Limnocylindrales bacterium]|nr:alpha/beta hydrolase [Candidatus Limnocylindrales bacterium]